jgi:hypothetical protein
LRILVASNYDGGREHFSMNASLPPPVAASQHAADFPPSRLLADSHVASIRLPH